MENYTVECVERNTIKKFIEKNHYSKNINGLKTSFCFGLYDEDALIGACLFGQLSTTSWKKYSDCEDDVLELRRLVLIDNTPKNTESWFIARCINYVKKNSNYTTIVSYADPHYDHIGYIYQASNFYYLGTTNKDKLLKDIDTGKTYHSRALRTKYKGEYKPFVKVLREKYERGLLEEITVPGKHIYVYPLKKSIKKKFKDLKKEYPKDIDGECI
jgi:hypothetical protein